MSYTGSSTTINSNSMYHYFRRKALETVEANLVMVPLGLRQPLPKGFGKIVKFIAYPNLAVVTSTLTEGTMPTAIALSSNSITASIGQYGQVVQLSDLCEATAADDIEEAIRGRIAFNAARSIDQLIHTELKTAVSGNRLYANGSALSAVSTVLVAADFLTAAVGLSKNDIAPHTGDDFVSVIHPAVSYDIMGETTSNASWAEFNKYMSNTKIFNGELGKLYGCRLVQSSQVKSAASGKSSATVYWNYTFGKDPFACTSLDSGGGKGFEIIIMPFGSGGAVGDALKQVMSIGWKANFVAKYLGNIAAPVSSPHRARQMIGISNG